AGRGHGRAVRLGDARPRLPDRRPVARRRVRLAGDRARPADDAAPRRAPVPLLAPLPRAAVRLRSPGSGRLMLDPETERKNLLLGWGLFVLFCLLAAGTVAIAFIYLAVD